MDADRPWGIIADHFRTEVRFGFLTLRFSTVSQTGRQFGLENGPGLAGSYSTSPFSPHCHPFTLTAFAALRFFFFM